MTNIDEKRKKNNVCPCGEITPFEYLWCCDLCIELFQNHRTEEQEKKAVEKKREAEVIINEMGDLGKWSGGE